MELPPPADDRDLAATDEDLYGLDELLALAGERLGEEISTRTVRLYVTQGLIDRPGRQSRHAVYRTRHLLQLLLIRSLARRGLSLSAIAPLCSLTDAEIEQQLGDLENGELPSREAVRFRQPALAYLQSLRGSGSMPPGVSAARAATAEGRELQLEIEEECKAVDSSRSLLPLLGAPIEGSGTVQRTPRGTSVTRRGVSSRWYRFLLMPGVELHLSDTVVVPPEGVRRRQWLRKLADRLIDLLDAKDG
jgi:DNA-binding transcriptional MerR regulator